MEFAAINMLLTHKSYLSYLSFTSYAVCAVQALEHWLASVIEWTRANKLKLKSHKTEVLLLGGSPDGLGGDLLVWIELDYPENTMYTTWKCFVIQHSQ